MAMHVLAAVSDLYKLYTNGQSSTSPTCWCGHCKNLAPTWDELSDHFSGSAVTIAKVDCTVDTQLCAEQEVRGYPTLKLFNGGEVTQYRGSRDIESLTDFVRSKVEELEQRKEEEERVRREREERERDKRELREQVKQQEEEHGEPPAPVVDDTGIVHLTESNFQSYIVSNPGVHFVKFYAPWCGHCKNLAPTWSELATYYEQKENVHIIKVDCTQDQGLCQRHGVRGYPTLLLFEDGLFMEKYSGNRALDKLIEFVEENMQEEEEAHDTGVVELTDESFQDAVAQGTTFVKFFAPWCGHCQQLAPTWQKLAEIVRGSPDRTIAKVDCTVEKDLCSRHGVHGYPTLVLFRDGERKAEYQAARDLDSLLQFVQDHSS